MNRYNSVTIFPGNFQAFLSLYGLKLSDFLHPVPSPPLYSSAAQFSSYYNSYEYYLQLTKILFIDSNEVYD